MSSEIINLSSLDSPPVLSVNGVSKSFQMHSANSRALLQQLWGQKTVSDEFWALKDVSFQVHKGETVGIVGRNGSGKSTLLQIIAGTLQPTDGNAFVNGRVAALLELGSGFNPEFTGRENVYLNAAILGLSRAETEARLQSILDFADIGEFIDQPVRNYSSGMTVRLAFAVIAHVDATVLIIDEALSVGDAFFSQKCMRFLRQFQKDGTLLFVSHDAAAVTNLCSRAIWLNQGKIAAQGPAQDVVEQYMALQHVGERMLGDAAIKLKDNSERSARRARAAPKDRTNRPSTTYEIFEIDPEQFGTEFGAGQAKIENVQLTDDFGKPLQVMRGEDRVQLKVHVRLDAALGDIIVGFYVKDRLGQRLFGDNTHDSYLENPISGNAGEIVVATFDFAMPTMPSGSYMIDVAVATGTQSDHVQQHWIHDALEFRATDETMKFGLMRVPMNDIQLTVERSQ